MSKEIGRDFVPEIGKSLDDQIITNGLEAAHTMLPTFEWSEIKEQFKTMTPPKRHAALFLRRKQLARIIDIASAAEMIVLALDAEELRVCADGKIKFAPTDQIFWDKNLNDNTLNNN